MFAEQIVETGVSITRALAATPAGVIPVATVLASVVVCGARVHHCR
jgi:hypothetical protein